MLSSYPAVGVLCCIFTDDINVMQTAFPR